MKNGLLCILVVAFVVATSVTTHAYRFITDPGSGTRVKWSNPSVTMTFNGANMPNGSLGNQFTQHAMYWWNQTHGSAFRFYYKVADYSPVRNNNDGVNTVGFLHGVYFPTGALATTSGRYNSSKRIIEVDVAFNNGLVGFPPRTSFSWRYSTVASCSDGIPYSFTEVAIHELGHVIGLDHENRVACVMNSIYGERPLGPSRALLPNADDCQGARVGYPKFVLPKADLAAGHNLGASRISVPTWARAGGAIGVGYNIHNLGSGSATHVVGVYLSTNSTITTSDRRIDFFMNSIGRGGNVQGIRSVLIPRDVSPGLYYIGYIVDYTNVVAELRETNNASSFCLAAIQIYAPAATVVAEGRESSDEGGLTTLDPNSPNPFNPTTTIRFSLAESGPVDLAVFNIRGERVRTLASGDASAGAHTFEWDGRDERGNTVASGVYFYRLSAPNFAQTRKMLLLK